MDFDKRLENQIEKDIQHLRRLGYAQELYRTIGGFSNFAITFSVISILSGLMTLYGYGLSLVGPFSIWTWAIVGLFQLMVALALGDIASIYPLAGGVYKWTGRLGNPHVGWFCGCFSLLGWLACTAGIQFGMGVFLTAYFGFELSAPNILLVTAIIIIAHSIINIFGIRLVAKITDFSVGVHIIGAAVLVGLLLVFGRNNPIEYILHVGNVPQGMIFFNFIQALLMSAWTLTAFDASTNVSEESINPSKVVPWGMVFAVVCSWVLGSLLLLSLNLSLPGLRETLDSGFPAALYVIRTVLGTTIYKFITIFILLAQFTAGLSSQTVTIRIIYSFSRDKGMPFSHLWKNVSSKYSTPVYSVLLISGAAFLLCVFAPSLYMITSLSTIGLYFAYAITMAVAIFERRKLQANHGPFHLGKFRFPVQVISLLWTIFITLIMVVPPIGQIGKVFLLATVFITFYYFTVMRKQLGAEFKYTLE